MKKRRMHTIFALVFGNTAYVGKTTSMRLSWVYRRHRRGDVQATKIFSNKGIKPMLHYFLRDEMEAFEAYRWVVSYVAVFQEAGYELLNSIKTIENANDLHPETKTLVEQIKEESLQELLEKTLVPKPSEADLEANRKVKLSPASEKLTVRLSKWEKERIDGFAAKMHMTQREMIQFLISSYEMPKSEFPPWEDDVYVRSMLGALREENEKLHKANERNRKQINKWRSQSMEDERLKRVSTALSLYFSFMDSSCRIPLEVERQMYKNYPYVKEYSFPEKPGIYIVRVNAVLTGKGKYPAEFVLGTGEDGAKYKFRYYPKKYYTGIGPNNKQFMLRGSIWVLGCEEARDGAMDLSIAFPLEVRMKNIGGRNL